MQIFVLAILDEVITKNVVLNSVAQHSFENFLLLPKRTAVLHGNILHGACEVRENNLTKSWIRY